MAPPKQKVEAVNLTDPEMISPVLLQALKDAGASGVEISSVRLKFGESGQPAVVSITVATDGATIAGAAKLANAARHIEEALGPDTIVRTNLKP